MYLITIHVHTHVLQHETQQTPVVARNVTHNTAVTQHTPCHNT